MRLMNIIFAVILFIASATVSAKTSAPNIQQLEADWWTYFSPEKKLTDELLEQRLDQLDRSLTRMGDTLNAKHQSVVLPLIIQLRELIVVYRQHHEPTTVGALSLAPEKESYLLAEAFELQLNYLALSTEVKHQRSDILWRRELIDAERKQQSQRKISYAEYTKTNTVKLALALEVMLSRFQLEIDLIALQEQQAKLEQLVEKKSTLQKHLKNIVSLVVLQAEDLEYWEKQHRQSLEEIIQIRKQAVRDSSAGQKANSLQMTDRQLRISTEELRAARADIILTMIQLTRSEQASILDQLKQNISAAESLLKSQTPKQAYIINSLSALYGWEENNNASNNKAAQPTQLLASIKRQLNTAKTELALLKFTISLAKKRMLLGRSNLEDSWLQLSSFVSNSYETLHTLLATSLFEINEAPVTFMGLLRLLIIIFISWVLSRTARGAIDHFSSQRPSVSPSSIYALSRVLHYLILSIGVVIGLSSIGVDFTKFALMASALSIGIGFGLQALVSNFVAGLIILFEKSLKVGDFVELESGITGEVMEINMRSTLITTNDNIDILVPNSEFINKNVTNWTLREVYRRVRVPFGVAYGSDKELVKKAALEAAENVNWTLKTDANRKPQVWLVKFGDSSLDFELVVWLIPEAVKRPSSVQASYLWEISSKLAEYKIEIPFPQRDLHLRSGFDVLVKKEL